MFRRSLAIENKAKWEKYVPNDVYMISSKMKSENSDETVIWGKYLNRTVSLRQSIIIQLKSGETINDEI